MRYFVIMKYWQSGLGPGPGCRGTARLARSSDPDSDQELVGVSTPPAAGEAVESASCQKWRILQARTLDVCESSKAPSRAASEKNCIIVKVQRETGSKDWT